jgi:hypothetical protein
VVNEAAGSESVAGRVTGGRAKRRGRRPAPSAVGSETRAERGVFLLATLEGSIHPGTRRRRSRMQQYCLPLELIAFALHPGDSQSTTTICLDASSACLYLTSQDNFKFEGVSAGNVSVLIEYLAWASKEYQGGATDIQRYVADYWEKFCALVLKQEATSSEGVKEKIKKLYTGLYTTLWQKFLNKRIDQSTFMKLKSSFLQLFVIDDDDIFYAGKKEKTGFHGESRIIRFLFVRDFPAIYLARTGAFFYQQPGKDISAEMKDNARTWFREHIKSKQLAVGSSQGTCSGCAECLENYGIAYGDVGNKPSQWLDPITMCGYQSGTKITKSESFHALFVAFRYLLRPGKD